MIKITPDSIKSIDRWIMAAKEFANEYSCVIYLETSKDSTGEFIHVELCHTSDENKKFSYRCNILGPRTSREIRNIFRRLYCKLGIRQEKIDWAEYLKCVNSY